MLGTFKSLMTTLRIAFRPPVTAEYPTTPAVLASRFMAHPVLTWDKDVVEPYCTGCLVCMRICPTDCIDVSMKDNPKHASSDSSRRKIVDDFELNVADCIMCGLCVEYCNFDAIIMSDHFDASQYARPNLVLGLDELLEQGKGQEAKGRWSPPEAKKSARRTAAQGTAAESGAATGAVNQAAGQGSADAATVDPRVAESRRKVAELKAQRAAQQSAAAGSGPEAPTEAQAPTDGRAVDPRVVEGRRRAAELRAQRAAEQGAATDLDQAAATETQATESGSADAVTVDPRVEEGRRRAAELRAQRAAERAAQESASAPSDQQDADGPADSSGVERE